MRRTTATTHVEAEFDCLYQVPILRHRTAEGLAAASMPERAVHEFTFGETTLSTFVRVADSPVLIVGFHGAVDRSRTRLPLFERFISSHGWPGSVMHISDPTLTLSPKLRLGWYVGSQEVDVEAVLVATIRAVANKLRARCILFTGSSGGGFAALKLSHCFPGSIAAVFNPQTNVPDYYSSLVTSFLKVCFPDEATTTVADSLQGRLSCVARYRTGHDNRIYVVQNQSDKFHLERHFIPLAAALGVGREGGKSADGCAVFLLENYGQGHAPPPQPLYAQHLTAALAMFPAETPQAG